MGRHHESSCLVVWGAGRVPAVVPPSCICIIIKVPPSRPLVQTACIHQERPAKCHLVRSWERLQRLEW